MLLHFALKANIIHSLTSGTLAPFPQEWTTLRQRESHWELVPDSSTNGSDRLCTDDSPAAAIIPACALLQEGPRPRLPTGGDNKPLKPKSRRSGNRWHYGLAGGGNHLCSGEPHQRRRPPQHRRQRPPTHQYRTSERRPHQRARRGLRSRPHYGSEDKTIQERRPHPHGVRRLVRPPSMAGAAGEAMGVASPRMARPSPVRWTGSHAPPQR
jgi:hypothetical protein